MNVRFLPWSSVVPIVFPHPPPAPLTEWQCRPKETRRSTKPHSCFHSFDALTRPRIGRDTHEIEQQGVRIVPVRGSPGCALRGVFVPDHELLTFIHGDASVRQSAVIAVTPDRARRPGDCRRDPEKHVTLSGESCHGDIKQSARHRREERAERDEGLRIPNGRRTVNCGRRRRDDCANRADRFPTLVDTFCRQCL